MYIVFRLGFSELAASVFAIARVDMTGHTLTIVSCRLTLASAYSAFVMTYRIWLSVRFKEPTVRPTAMAIGANFQLHLRSAV
jgi:hypothetical protein